MFFIIVNNINITNLFVFTITYFIIEKENTIMFACLIDNNINITILLFNTT